MADAPGPIALVDIPLLGLKPIAPTFAPFVKQFTDLLPALHTAADVAHRDLSEAGNVDAGGALDGTLQTFADAAVDDFADLDLQPLQEAVTNYDVAVDQYIRLQKALPPEASSGATIELTPTGDGDQPIEPTRPTEPAQ